MPLPFSRIGKTTITGNSYAESITCDGWAAAFALACRACFGLGHTVSGSSVRIETNRPTSTLFAMSKSQSSGCDQFPQQIIMVFATTNWNVLRDSWLNMRQTSLRLGMSSSTLRNDPKALNVSIQDEKLVVDLVDGRTLIVPLNWYPRLSHATPDQQRNWTLVGGGYAIHWPDLDEDIRVEGLLAGNRSGESQKSFEQWLSGRKRRE